LVKFIKKYKMKSNPCDKLLTFKDFHSIRFSFVYHLFFYYSSGDSEFLDHLKGLKSWYIWNIYKQLSWDILDKIQQA